MGISSVLRNTVPLTAPVLVTLVVAPLSGCGGGGGGGGSDAVVSSAAPVAVSSTIATLEDSAVDSTLIASDAEGDPLSYSIVSPASMGTATITDDTTGAFTYTPNPDVNGTDSFAFKANDGSADSNTATVTVTVTSVDDAPVAENGNVTTDEDTTTNGTLNASDKDGDALTFQIVSNGALGIATITDPTTGAYTYTPNPNANGDDSFTFAANDGTNDSNTAAVTVTVIAVNDPPVASGSCSNTPQSANLTGTLLANDPELDLLTYSLIDPADGLPAGQGPITTAKGGTITLTSASGDFLYQPANSGARGIDTFDYQVSDPDGGTSTATETVIVDQTIMPLGDSITRGKDSDTPDVYVGYRKPLFEKLLAAGYTFDFVGTLTDSIGSPPLFDPDHEGHGGWTAIEIARSGGPVSFPSDTGSIFDWLNDQPADVILLHIGTNDIFQSGFGSASDVAEILDEIDRWENVPNNPVTVIVGRIIEMDPFDPVMAPAVSDFNDAVEAMVNQRSANGDNVIMVDHYSALTYPPASPNDMSDNLHPNASGYEIMADVWLDALSQPNPNFLPNTVNVIDKCP